MKRCEYFPNAQYQLLETSFLGPYSYPVSQCQPATHADVPASDSPQPFPAAGPEDLLQTWDVPFRLQQHGQCRQLPGVDLLSSFIYVVSSVDKGFGVE